MKKLMFLFALALLGCDKSAAPLTAEQTAARRTCMDTIESRATNRNSIAYQSEDAPPVKNAKGQLEASIKFSAKSEIGIASSLLAKCTVSADGKSLVDIAVKDSR